MAAAEGRVLALQSHVVRGHVGADAFSFPLQRLGIDVGCIYTCQFVDLFVHEGPQLQAEKLKVLLQHLKPESFMLLTPEAAAAAAAAADADAAAAAAAAAAAEPPFRYLASGFVGTGELLQTFAAWLEPLKKALGPAASPIFLCDPVMGDGGQLYVHPNCVEVYCSKLLPLADIITPNQFEAGWILGHRKQLQQQQQIQQQQQQQQQGEKAGWRHSTCACVELNSWSDVLAAVDALHEEGPEVVVLTSVQFAAAAAAAEAHQVLAAADPNYHQQQQQQQQQQQIKAEDYLFIVASRRARQQQRCAHQQQQQQVAAAAEAADVLYALSVPMKKGFIGGAGDLFAAAFLAFFIREQFHLGRTLTKAVAACQAVIEATVSRSPRPRTVDAVAAQSFLENPPQQFLRNAIRLSR